MFDFLRDLRKSEEDKNQEALTAYLDDALTPGEKERFEQLLASDESLHASLEEQRLIRATMRRLPRIRAPRNFTLDPALYGRPVSSAADRFYPIMRTATAVVAILFVLVLVLDFVPFGGADEVSDLAMIDSAELATQAMEAAAPAEALAPLQPEAESEEALVGRSAVEVTRVVEAIKEAVEMTAAAEKPAEEMIAEAIAEEAIVEEAELPAAAEDASGGGAPAEEAPLADEGLPAALETEPAGERDGDTLSQPLAARPSGTPAAAGELALTEETLLSQPTPSRAARVVPAASDDAADVADAETKEPAASGAAGGLSTLQILAIILGLCLVALALASLALRRSQR